MRIGIYGGAFDPVTLGHKTVLEVIQNCGLVDQVWVAPCLSHPFDKKMAPFDDRVAMCKFGLKIDDKATFLLTSVQHHINSEKTYDVLKYLGNENPSNQYFVIIGCDQAREIHRWYKWEELTDHYKFIIVKRWGHARAMRPIELKYWETCHYYLAPNPAIPNISSSCARLNFSYIWPKIGAILQNRKSLDKIYTDELSGLVSRKVFEYVISKRLYREGLRSDKT
jgi:nicotinate-nucleotide adenylyltransferase